MFSDTIKTEHSNSVLNFGFDWQPPLEPLRNNDVEDILISWFVIILALLGVALLFVCCMMHCKHLR